MLDRFAIQIIGILAAIGFVWLVDWIEINFRK